MNRLLDFAVLARPRDWVKNAFVLMPVPFAVAAGATLEPLSLLLGLVAMCLMASAVYALNDVMDAEQDRLHPIKRRRPVAAGRIRPAAALMGAGGLCATSLVLAAWAGGRPAAATVGAYAALNVAYCLGAKNVPLIDVFLLSSGFVLRVVLGSELVGAAPSKWLLLCSSSLAMFLALGKRRGDLLEGMDGEHRPVLSGYNVRFLDQSMGITAGIALIGYALYTLDAEILVDGREFATVPFAVFGVLEYLRLTQVRGQGASPVDVILSSPVIALCGLGWLLAALWSVPLGR